MKPLVYRFLNSFETGVLELTQEEFKNLKLALNEEQREYKEKWNPLPGIVNPALFTGIRVIVVEE